MFAGHDELKLIARRRKNLMITGRHGVGKTGVIIDVFDEVYGEEGKDWVYFNGATMDPWITLLGIPLFVKNDRGEEVTRMVPPEQLSADIRAIYVDEFNRASKEARNGFMELLQRKSVNGRKFKNLEVVWTAINPSHGGEYDVDVLDLAQEDRFQAQIHFPYDVVPEFFHQKFGKSVGDVAVKWWRNLDYEHQLLCSPRRLDDAVQCILEGDNLKHYLPDAINATSLLKSVKEKQNKDSILSIIDALKTEEIPEYFSAQRVIEHAEFFKKHQQVFKQKVLPNLSKAVVDELIQRAPETAGLSDLIVTAGLFNSENTPLAPVLNSDFKLTELLAKINNGPSKASIIGTSKGSSIPFMEPVFEAFSQIYTLATVCHPMTPTLELGRSDRLLAAMCAWKILTDDLPDIHSKLLFVMSYARHSKQDETQLSKILRAVSNFATYDFQVFVSKRIEDEGAMRFLGDMVGIGGALKALELEHTLRGGGSAGYFGNRTFKAFHVAATKLLRSNNVAPVLYAQFGENLIESIGDFTNYCTSKNPHPIKTMDAFFDKMAGV
jgi:hypothetical protein